MTEEKSQSLERKGMTEYGKDVLGDLANQLSEAGWLLREPLDFSSRGDQDKIRNARSIVARVHLQLVKVSRPSDRAGALSGRADA